MSTIQTEDLSKANRQTRKSIAAITAQRDAVRAKLQAYYAGTAQGMTADEAAGLRGELRAFEKALEALEAKACASPLPQIGREPLGPVVLLPDTAPRMLQLREGAFYEMEDKQIAGPTERLEPGKLLGGIYYSWCIENVVYTNNGWTSHEPWRLVREVPKPS